MFTVLEIMFESILTRQEVTSLCHRDGLIALKSGDTLETKYYINFFSTYKLILAN